MNLSRSMPRGIYRLNDQSIVHRGDLLAVCLPSEISVIGRARNYLASGSCPDRTEPLLKTVAAVTGDVVETSARSIVLNGVELPSSETSLQDSNRRSLAHLPFGTRVVGPREVWLFSPSPKSWDSRYFGPISIDHVIGHASPILTID